MPHINLTIDTRPTLDYEEIYKICNAIAYTSKIKTLQLPIKNKGKPIMIRPQAHACICGDVGQGKSTILRNMAAEMQLPVIGSFTKAGLLGTINREGQGISPLIWDYRKQPIFIDEFFMSATKDAIDFNNCLLSVLEERGFTRKLGYSIKDFEEKDETDSTLYYRTKSSNIQVKSRFSFIFSTMQNYFKTDLSMQKRALITRVILLPLHPTQAELRRMIEGEIAYKHKAYAPEENCRISKAIHRKIIDLVIGMQVRKDSQLRTIGDLCRLYSVVGWKKEFFEPILLQRRKIRGGME